MNSSPRELKCFHCGKPDRAIVSVIEKNDGAWFDDKHNGWFDNKGKLMRPSMKLEGDAKRRRVVLYHSRKDNYLGNNSFDNLIALCIWCKALHEGKKKENITKPVEPELFKNGG